MFASDGQNKIVEAQHTSSYKENPRSISWIIYEADGFHVKAQMFIKDNLNILSFYKSQYSDWHWPSKKIWL